MQANRMPSFIVLGSLMLLTACAGTQQVASGDKSSTTKRSDPLKSYNVDAPRNNTAPVTTAAPAAAVQTQTATPAPPPQPARRTGNTDLARLSAARDRVVNNVRGSNGSSDAAVNNGGGGNRRGRGAILVLVKGRNTFDGEPVLDEHGNQVVDEEGSPIYDTGGRYRLCFQFLDDSDDVFVPAELKAASDEDANRNLDPATLRVIEIDAGTVPPDLRNIRGINRWSSFELSEQSSRALDNGETIRPIVSDAQGRFLFISRDAGKVDQGLSNFEFMSLVEGMQILTLPERDGSHNICIGNPDAIRRRIHLLPNGGRVGN